MSDVFLARVFADQQIWGDIPAEEFFTEIFQKAIEKKDIQAYKIHMMLPGPYGMEYTYFSVDIVLPVMEVTETYAVATAVLNEIVGDTDVSVRWIQHVD